jgi:hypothetical protein
MIKPKQKHFLSGANKQKLQEAAEINLREAVDLLKIDKHGAISMNTDCTGYKTVRSVPSMGDVSNKTGIPIPRIKKLIKKGLVEEGFGVRPTFSAFVQFWYFVGANPWYGI